MLVGLQIVAFFARNPYLISLADWRNIVTEEADALMHASVVKVSPCGRASARFLLFLSVRLAGDPGQLDTTRKILGARASRLQSRPIHCVLPSRHTNVQTMMHLKSVVTAARSKLPFGRAPCASSRGAACDSRRHALPGEKPAHIRRPATALEVLKPAAPLKTR